MASINEISKYVLTGMRDSFPNPLDEAGFNKLVKGCGGSAFHCEHVKNVLWKDDKLIKVEKLDDKRKALFYLEPGRMKEIESIIKGKDTSKSFSVGMKGPE